MTRDELLAALELIDNYVPFDSREGTAAYYNLKEFIIQNTKTEEKIPALLKGINNVT